MKKFISVLLVVSIMFSVFGICSSAKEEGTNYPYVFVHGMMGWGSYDGVESLVPYWGLVNGDMLDDLRADGIECYSASVGKISSNWDRACELYAQLTGTRVDYGEKHSAEHNHARFGRSYEGNALMDSFGKKDENGDLIKINLIGHSLGGPTVRLFAYMLEYGDKEECATSGEDVSPLFKGGKGEYVYSVCTMSAPHNGTAVSNIMYDDLGVSYLLTAMGGFLGMEPIARFWDFQLEQYGITSYREQGFKSWFSIKGIMNMISSDDNCGYDLSIRGANALNEKIDIVDGIYYFSYTGEQVTKKDDGTYVPPLDMFPLFTPFSYMIGKFNGEVYDGVVMTEEWRENDGLISVISASAPFDEPSVKYEDVTSKTLKKGVWHVMPLIDDFSHVSYMGMDTSEFSFVYENHIKLVNSL